ncbi:MAG: hypothetical protein DSM106950_27680 [Stigonema ocellatum SAG 48.90 = DSM 106950]|nr:hypothetical protein [Stigonema ocellatum SAG 48.90 = DSM 106950]
MMTVKDLEKLQATLSEAGDDYQLELENGKIIVMGPSDIVSIGLWTKKSCSHGDSGIIRHL